MSDRTLLGDRLANLAFLHSLWSQQTFGADNVRGPAGPLKHLIKEAQECIDSPTDITEYADCFLLILDASRRAGFDIYTLVKAAQDKLKINKAREWPKVADMNAEVEHKKPTIVCLCGSTRFKNAFIEANRIETLNGKIVLSVGMFGHEEKLDMSGYIKQGLDELHKRKIDISNEILVLNVGGYIGSSTKSEIEYAVTHGKRVRYLE